MLSPATDIAQRIGSFSFANLPRARPSARAVSVRGDETWPSSWLGYFRAACARATNLELAELLGERLCLRHRLCGRKMGNFGAC